MLQGAFSFKGRVGRLDYFLASLVMGLAIVVAVLGVMLITKSLPHSTVSTGLVVIFCIVLAFGLAWFSLSLQVRRIRDIGWSPFYVLIGCLIFQFVDSIVALKVPALAVAHYHHTAVGVIANLVVSLVLLFWPGRDGDGDAAAPRPPRLDSRDYKPAPRPVAASPRVGSLSRPAQVGFGRRGLR